MNRYSSDMIETMKTSTITLFLTLLFTSCNILQDTDNTTGGLSGRCGPGAEVNVLFIGESEIIDSDIAQSTLDHACGERKNIAVKVYAPFGFGLAEHAADFNLEEKLILLKWDFIIIAEHSSRIRDSQYNFDSISVPAMNQLKSRISHLSPESKIYLLSNWSSFTDYDDDSIIIQNRYNSLASAVNIPLIKLNFFWEIVFNDSTKPFDSNALWAADTVSPSVIGKVLTSALIYRTLAGKAVSSDAFDEQFTPAMYIRSMVNQFLKD